MSLCYWVRGAIRRTEGAREFLMRKNFRLAILGMMLVQKEDCVMQGVEESANFAAPSEIRYISFQFPKP